MEKTFIKLTIKASDLGLSDTSWKSAYVAKKPTYGNAIADPKSHTLTYVPNEVIKGIDEIFLTIEDNEGKSITHTICIYPATSVYYDLEVVEDEDTTDDVDISDDSNEDVDSDVTVEEEQADESGTDEFSDGSDLGVSEDGAEAVGDATPRDTGAYEPREGDVGTCTVAGNDVYEYHRYRTTDGEYSGNYLWQIIR